MIRLQQKAETAVFKQSAESRSKQRTGGQNKGKLAVRGQEWRQDNGSAHEVNRTYSG